MTDPADIPAPDNTGTITLRRFTYQEKVAARCVIAMLGEGGGVLHVTGEHIEDVTVAIGHPPDPDDVLWHFVQVKKKDDPAPWGLSDVIAGSITSGTFQGATASSTAIAANTQLDACSTTGITELDFTGDTVITGL